MRTLHEIPAVPPVDLALRIDLTQFDDDDEDEERELRCPDCDGQYFIRTETGWFREHHYIDFTGDGRFPNENWEGDTQETEESSNWQCVRCNEDVPDWLEQLIDEGR